MTDARWQATLAKMFTGRHTGRFAFYHSENQKTLTKDDWHNGLKVDLGLGDGPQTF